MFKKKQPFVPGPKSGLVERRGVARLNPETHARLREIMVNPDDIPWSYERWRQETESYERMWKSRGHLVVWIEIDPEAFLTWCETETLQPNRQALERYVLKAATGVRSHLWDAA